MRVYADSMLTASATSDNKGRFTIEYVAPEENRAGLNVSVSCIGYESQVFQLQNVQADTDLGSIALSPSAHNVDEAVVTMERIKLSSEKIVQIPSKVEKSHSANAITLLNQMNIADLEVDINNGTVKANGKVIPIYIDFMPATEMDVAALHPDDIVRVEYNVHPKGELQRVGSPVVNIITRQRNSGGRLMAQVVQQEELKGGYKAIYMLYKKKNQFSIGYDGSYANQKDYNENAQYFQNPVDGISIVRHDHSDGVRVKSRSHAAVFGHTFRNESLHSSLTATWTMPQNPQVTGTTLRMQEGMGELTRVLATNSSKSYSPSLTWNFRKLWKKQHVLNIDAFVQYNRNKYNSQTQNYEGGADLPNYTWSNIADEDYTQARVMVNYSKSFADKGTLVAYGMANESWTSTNYSGDFATNSRIFYGGEMFSAGYTMTFGQKLNVAVLLGLIHSINNTKEADNKVEDFYFNPELNVNYTFKKATISFSGSTGCGNSNIPMKGKVMQSIDDLQMKVGNPYLKTARFLFLTLDGNWQLGKGMLGWVAFYKGTFHDFFNTTAYDASLQKYMQSFNSDGNRHFLQTQLSYNGHIGQRLRYMLAAAWNFYKESPHGDNFSPLHTLSKPFAYAKVNYLVGPFTFELTGMTTTYSQNQGYTRTRASLSFMASYTRPRYSIALTCNNLTNAARTYQWTSTGPLYRSTSTHFDETGKRRCFVQAQFTFNLQHGNKKHQYDEMQINTNVSSGIMK